MFRVWTYRSPAIVLGCSQHALREDIAARWGGQDTVVLRESGGGAVLVGPWLVGASVVLPYGHPWLGDGLIGSYRPLGQLHAAVLAALGSSARVVPPSELPAREKASRVNAVDWACFGSLSPWEVVGSGGRKLVGLAQRRRPTGVLLVAGTLTDTVDWSLLCAAMGQPQHEFLLRQRTVSLSEMTYHQIDPGQFASALSRQLEHALLGETDG